MGKIIKTKFYCKSTSRSGSSHVNFNNIQWFNRFVEGKWYDGSYELWYDEDEYSEGNQNLFRLNNIGGSGWRRYKVINEQGREEEMSKSHMNCIFEMNKIGIRDQKIEQILKK